MIARLVLGVAGLTAVATAALVAGVSPGGSRPLGALQSTLPGDTVPVDTVLATPVVLFIEPDSATLIDLRARVGDEDFYTIADDANWYRAQAWALLDSLGVPHRMVERRPLRFVVGADTVRYDWRDVEPVWFVILYDGRTAPRTMASVELDADALAPLRDTGGGRRRDHRPRLAQPPSVQ